PGGGGGRLARSHRGRSNSGRGAPAAPHGRDDPYHDDGGDDDEQADDQDIHADTGYSGAAGRPRSAVTAPPGSAGGSSPGVSRRCPTTLEVPSPLIETPYIICATSIVRFWCVTISTWESSTNPRINRRNRCRFTSSRAGSTSSIR